MSRYRVNHSTYRGYALIAGFVEIGDIEETVRRGDGGSRLKVKIPLFQESAGLTDTR
ncbi:MAG: hypothetical protein ACLR3S_12855 [Clostridium fessum]